MKNILTLFFLSFLTLGHAQDKADDRRLPGQVIVQLQADAEITSFLRNWNRTAPDQPLRLLRSLSQRAPLYLLGYAPERTEVSLLKGQLDGHPTVATWQFNYEVEERNTPNDPDLFRQTGLEIIRAEEAWDLATGGVTAAGDTIVIAVIESSFDPDHEDLRDNVWTNRFEIPGDGIDNDDNGYVDDLMGWDFVDSTAVLAPTTIHGTSVTGILGARGDNGTGIAGVNWRVRLMLLRATRSDQIVEAYQYMLDQRDRYNRSGGAEGAFVVATNVSFGISRLFCDEQPVWGAMYDQLGAAGILTGAGTDNQAYDVDEQGDMPATCPSDFLITTLNTTPDDRRYQGSAWGTTSIDIGTPGQENYSSRPNDNYGSFGGNSAAAPHLTGSIALLYSLPCSRLADRALTEPGETARVVREAILTGIDPAPALEEFTALGGRLNLFKSMQILQSYCSATPGDLGILNIFPNPTTAWTRVEYNTPEAGVYSLELYNALGQLVSRRPLEVTLFNRNFIDLDLSALPRSTYFLMLRKDGAEVVRRVIVY